MLEEEKDVNTVEPSATDQDVEEDSSASEDVSGEESSASEKQVQQVPYDRFREVNEERKQLQELVQQLASRQDKGETAREVEDDPYSGMDAETAHFYRNLDTRTQKLIQREAQRIAQPMQQQYQSLAKTVSELLTNNFRQSNKDVEPNSQEEKKIASLVSKGIDLDSATWAVMGPKRVESVKKGKVVKTQNQVQKKAQANLETQSIPRNSPLPKEKLSFREQMMRALEENGI